MSLDAVFQGSFFASDFPRASVAKTPDWQGLDEATIDALQAALRTIFGPFPIAGAFRLSIVAP